MPHHSAYTTNTESNTDAIIRRCLQEFAKELQLAGEISPDVSEGELYGEVEKHVPTILSAVERNAMYHEWKQTGHLEEHIRGLVSLSLNLDHATRPDVRFGNYEGDFDRDANTIHWRERAHQPAVASDQVSYVHVKTGQSLTPTWKHHNCGGTVYPTNDDTFRCSTCKREGQLGAEMPEGLTRPEQMEYMLTQVEEVDLT